MNRCPRRQVAQARAATGDAESRYLSGAESSVVAHVELEA
jgi:hypothetical protein